MRAIIVDDEPLMLKRFVRMSAGLPYLNLVGQFRDPADALRYMAQNPVELAFIDIGMPVTDGLELARQLRRLAADVLIVFITAYDQYIREANQIGCDYYLVKPYERETLETVMKNMYLIAQRQQKSIYIQTFGRFVVLQNGQPVPLVGKAKELLAYLVTRRGKEVSNETIFSILWEDRTYSHANMTVYYNALNRLKKALQQAGISSLLISTPHGQMVNTTLFDCDYYAWQDRNMSQRERFEGEFLSEYFWGEQILAEMLYSE